MKGKKEVIDGDYALLINNNKEKTTQNNIDSETNSLNDKVYIRQNNNTERDDYFIKLNKKIKKLKLYRNKLYNGDTIILFNKTYNIIIYNNINPLYRNHNHKFNIFNYNYPVKYNEGNLGFIKPDRLNSRDFLLLYKNNSIRHGWNNKL